MLSFWPGFKPPEIVRVDESFFSENTKDKSYIPTLNIVAAAAIQLRESPPRMT